MSNKPERPSEERTFSQLRKEALADPARRANIEREKAALEVGIDLYELQRQLRDVECALEQAQRVIRNEHAYKATLGGAPCICEFCKSGEGE